MMVNFSLYSDFVANVLTYDLIVLLGGLVLSQSIAKRFPKEIQQPYLAIADKMNAFNRYVATEPRATATVIPVFNGVTQIMWK
jgi:hypothetical protein